MLVAKDIDLVLQVIHNFLLDKHKIDISKTSRWPRQTPDHAVEVRPQYRAGNVVVKLRGYPFEFSSILGSERLKNHGYNDAYSRFRFESWKDLCVLPALLDLAIGHSRAGDFRRRHPRTAGYQSVGADQ